MNQTIATIVRRSGGATGVLLLILVAASVVFGGASRQNELRLALVQLAAIPLLCITGFRLWESGIWRVHSRALLIVGLVIAIPLIQLIPLPPSIWQQLPNREDMITALTLSGVSPGWVPISVAPDRTWNAVLSLLPPLAAFGATLLLSWRRRRVVILAYIALTAVSIVIAAAQMASSNPAIYPYTTTQAGFAVGFFANRNHLATLVLMTLPFAIAFMTERARKGPVPQDVRPWLFGAFAVLSVIAIGAIRSRTGIILCVPILLMGLVMAARASRRREFNWRLLGLTGGTIVAVLAVATLGLAPILQRFGADRIQAEGRFQEWPVVVEAAEAYQPLGAGIGAFDRVFRSFEPLEHLDPTFFNHAHNDYLEIWLEAGVPGLIVAGLVIAWLGRRWFGAWARSAKDGEVTLQQAAGIAVLAIMLHSVVDYPARTETLAVLLAFCAGLLAKAPPSGDQGR